MSRIHYYSWVLDIAFTFPEWCEYLKEHSSSDAVADFGGWQFNVHGCCLNTNKAIKVGENNFQVEIRTYQIPVEKKRGNPLKWASNVTWTCGDSGGAGYTKTDCETELDAIIWMLEYMYNRFAEMKPYDYKEQTTQVGRERLMRKIQEEINNRKELTLF